MFPKTFWLLFSSVFPLLCHAAAPSGETWLTFKTPHFHVHHTPAQEIYARAFAAGLERSLPLLEKDLLWKAPTPIDIVITDPSDAPNGFAANFPNTYIEIFGVPFEGDSALGYYINWVDELAYHELTHIIANDTTTGAYPFLRSVFGSWVKPNGLQPTWLVEGLAVYQETELTAAGRGRSPLLETMFRTAAWKNALGNPDYLSLDRLNDGVRWWPAGNVPYLVGYTLQASAQRIAGKTGQASIPGQVSLDNSGNFPWSPNSAIKAVAQKDWPEIWEITVGRLKERYGPEPVMPEPCKITFAGRFTGGHVAGPDGWIYFTEQHPREGFSLARVRANAPCGVDTTERLAESVHENSAQVAVSPSGKKVIFARSDTYDSKYFYSDLFVYDLDQREERRLTRKERAYNPAFLDENSLLFVKNLPDSRQGIIRKDLNTLVESLVYQTHPFERISGLFAKKGRALFSLHDNAGVERIHELTAATGKVAPLPDPKTSATSWYERNPYLHDDGKIYFAGYYGKGSQDVFAFDPRTKSRTLVARKANGYLDRPVFGADGRQFFALAYGLEGFNIVRLRDGDQWIEPIKENTEDLHQFLSGSAGSPIKKGEEAPFAASEPYSLLRSPATSLWPQYWMPDFYVTDNGFLAGALTTGNDPLFYHSYGLSGQYDSRANFPLYRAFYLNREHTVNFFFEARQYNNYFLSSKTSNRASVYSGEALIPFKDIIYSFGTAFQEKHLFSRRSQNFLLFHNVRYHELSQKPEAIDPNRGQQADLYAGIFPAARDEDMFYDLRPSLQLAFPGFNSSHSFLVALQAGISTNRLLSSNYYLGGGPSVLSPSAYEVRGYPLDTLFGQRIATANFRYTLPLAHPYRGVSTDPLFLRSYGLRLHGDVGSASYLAEYSGKDFLRYRAQSIGKENLVGLGLDFVANGTVLYHVPLSLDLGVHYGLNKRHGGGWMAYFGANVGNIGFE